MKKYKIRLRYMGNQYRAEVLNLKRFWRWTWWEVILAQQGNQRFVNDYINQWCKSFKIDPDEVEDLTKK